MQTSKLLHQVGDRNRFQIFSIVFVCLKWMIISLSIFLPSYLFMAPTFSCNGKGGVLQADGCGNPQCQIEERYTLTTHLKLFCDQKYIRNSILSSQFIGSIIGLVLLSILADKLGRKRIIVSTILFSAFGASLLTLGGILKWLPSIFAGIILMGFGGYSLSMVSYSYLSEINNDHWRQKSLILTYTFWAVGEIMVYPIVTYLQEWQTICFFIFILPLLFLFILSYWTVETPQFLFCQRRYEQCLQSLNQIAHFNSLPKIDSLGTFDPPIQPMQTMGASLVQTQVLLPLIILSIAQACNNGYYYTAQFSLDQYGLGFEQNMLAIGILELISCLITNNFCHLMKRKRWIIFFMVLAGATGITVQLFQNSETVELIFVGAGRLFNTVAFSLFSLICSQSFPTAIKSTGMGITEAASNIGNILAPFLVLFANQAGLRPLFVGGVINVIGGLFMGFVKETKIDSENDEQTALLPAE